MRSATAILSEIRNGDLVLEISDALSQALAATLDVGKASTVTIKVTIDQLTKMKLSEPAVGYTGDVSTKLAKPDPEETIFFVDENRDPTRQPSRQTQLGLTVAGSENKGTGT